MTVENEHKPDELSNNQIILLRSGLRDRRDIRRLGEAIYDAEALEIEGKLPVTLEGLLKDSRKYYDEFRKQLGEETTAMRHGDLKSRYDAVRKIMNCVAVGQKYIYDATTNTDKPAYQILQEAQNLFTQACEDTAQYELAFADKNKKIHPRYSLQRLEMAIQQPFDEVWLRKLREKQEEIRRIVNAQEKAEKIHSDALQESDYLHRFESILYAYSIFQNIPGLAEQIEQTRHIAISVLTTQIIDAVRYAEVIVKSYEFEKAKNKIRDAEARLSSWPEQEKPVEINDLGVRLQETKNQVIDTEKSWHEYIHYAKIIREQIVSSDTRALATKLFDRIVQDDRFQKIPDLHILEMEVKNYNIFGEQLTIAKSAYAQLDWSRTIEITSSILKSGMAGKLAHEFYDLQNASQLELNIQMLYEKIFAENYKEARYLLNRILSTQDKDERTSLQIRLSSETQFLKEKTGF